MFKDHTQYNKGRIMVILAVFLRKCVRFSSFTSLQAKALRLAMERKPKRTLKMHLTLLTFNLKANICHSSLRYLATSRRWTFLLLCLHYHRIWTYSSRLQCSKNIKFGPKIMS